MDDRENFLARLKFFTEFIKVFKNSSNLLIIGCKNYLSIGKNFRYPIFRNSLILKNFITLYNFEQSIFY